MNEFIQNKIKERINELMNTNTIPWFKPWSEVNGAGVNYFSRHKYHGLNRLFLGDGEYATFNQIKEHKAKLNKGAKGKLVICPIIKEITYDDAMEESEEKATNVAQKLTGFRYAFVYDIADTNLPSKISYEKHEYSTSTKEEKALEITMNLIERLGITLKEKVSGEAFYETGSDTITIPKKDQFKSVSEYLHTLLHEVGHATGSSKRLKRNLSGQFASSSYAKEELVAEIFSLSALAELGLNNPFNEEQTVAYLKEWKKYCSENVDALLSASNQADKALSYCFN